MPAGAHSYVLEDSVVVLLSQAGPHVSRPLWYVKEGVHARKCTIVEHRGHVVDVLERSHHQARIVRVLRGSMNDAPSVVMS